MSNTLTIAPSPTGMPRVILRLEGAALLLAALVAYDHLQTGWGWFAAWFLVPDLTMLAYLAGPRVGAVAYNASHSTLSAGALLGIGWWGSVPWAVPLAVIWLAHIGFDRMLGYGLKYPSAFGHTHLGMVGRRGFGGT